MAQRTPYSLNTRDALHDLVIQFPVELRSPAAGDLRHQLIEVLSQQPGDDAGEAIELAPFDLIDLDPKPGRTIDAGLDVDLGFDVEAKLPPALGCLRASADLFGDRAGHRRMKLAFDLAGDQKPASARVDRGEPEGMDRTSIVVGLVEGHGGSFSTMPSRKSLESLTSAEASARRPTNAIQQRILRTSHDLDGAIGAFTPEPPTGNRADTSWIG